MIADYRKKIDRGMERLRAAKQQRAAERTSLSALRDRAVSLAAATQLAQTVAQQVQQEAQAQVSTIVSMSLAAVFDDPYSFKIRFDMKRGRTEAVLVFEENGVEIDPMTASAGGAVDVAAFALRLSCLLLSRPAKRRLLVMDEPFRFVARENLPRLRALLEKLSIDMECQFILVTHHPELETGKVIRL